MRGSYVFINMEIEPNYTRRFFLLFSLSISRKEAVKRNHKSRRSDKVIRFIGFNSKSVNLFTLSFQFFFLSKIVAVYKVKFAYLSQRVSITFSRREYLFHRSLSEGNKIENIKVHDIRISFNQLKIEKFVASIFSKWEKIFDSKSER